MHKTWIIIIIIITFIITIIKLEPLCTHISRHYAILLSPIQTSFDSAPILTPNVPYNVCMHADRQTDRHIDRQTDIHIDRQTDIHIDRQTDIHIDRQTDRQTDRQF